MIAVLRRATGQNCNTLSACAKVQNISRRVAKRVWPMQALRKRQDEYQADNPGEATNLPPPQLHPAQGITAPHQRLPVGRQPAAARDHSRRPASHLRLRARQLHPDAAHRRGEDEPDATKTRAASASSTGGRGQKHLKS